MLSKISPHFYRPTIRAFCNESGSKTLQTRAFCNESRPKTLQSRPFCNENGLKTLQKRAFCNENALGTLQIRAKFNVYGCLIGSARVEPVYGSQVTHGGSFRSLDKLQVVEAPSLWLVNSIDRFGFGFGRELTDQFASDKKRGTQSGGDGGAGSDRVE